MYLLGKMSKVVVNKIQRLELLGNMNNLMKRFITSF